MKCPVHGQLLKPQTGAAYDHPSAMTCTQDYLSMTYTHSFVPVQVTVQPSSIPGASQDVFSSSIIEKGVCIDPNEGDKVSKNRDSTT